MTLIPFSRLVAALMLCTAFVMTATSAAATSSKVRKHTTTITTEESDEEPTPTPSASPSNTERDYLIEKVFGSKAANGIDGCKTDDLAERTKQDLERECKAWMKEQKSDLGTKYQTGTCNDECEDCGISLKRCKVRGLVHYAK